MTEKRFAIGLVRLINTAEMKYRNKQNSFATWEQLAVSPDFQELKEKSFCDDPKLKDINTGNPSQIAQGWQLRLLLGKDGKTYVVVLTNTTDQNCGFSFVSDEGGLIREAKLLGCS